MTGNGVRCIIAIDELSTFLSKGLQSATQDIPSLITDMSVKSKRQFKLSDKAFELYDEWYHEVYKELVQNKDDLKTEATARMITHSLKLSLVYAAISNAPEDNLISRQQFESAKAVGEYWGKCMGLTLEDMTAGRDAFCEQCVVKRLQEKLKDRDYITVRELSQSINTKTMGKNELNRAVENLITAEEIYLHVFPTGKKIISLKPFELQD